MNLIEEIRAHKPNLAIAPRISQKPGTRMLQVFLNIDMRNGHDGLAEIAKKQGIDIDDLKPGQYVAFINSKQSHLKLCASGHVVASFHKPGVKIDLRVISEIPRAFQGSGRIEYDKALKGVLLKALERKRVQPQNDDTH